MQMVITMRFQELSNEQRRGLINAQQLYQAWNSVARQFQHSYEGNYLGSMRWEKRDGGEYLIREFNRTRRSLGVRSAETEEIKDRYIYQRNELRVKKRRLEQRIRESRLVNVALRIGRVPDIAARIIRKIHDSGLLGSQMFIIGTNALFAYEARAGIHFEDDIIATDDMDFLWDARKRLGIASPEMTKGGILGLLQKVDSSFSTHSSFGYYAENNSGYIVDILCQETASNKGADPKSVTGIGDDLSVTPAEGLGWLINSPKFEEIAIDERGLPVLISCVDPRVFALHKLWLSKQTERKSIKRPRDKAQAEAVGALAKAYFQLDFQSSELSALPKELRALSKEIPSKAEPFLAVEESDIPQRGW
jgi:hypothetical protein